MQVFHRDWDSHSTLPAKLQGQCKDVDQPWAALIQDLKMRGLLQNTLVACSGEFGRTVYSQGKQTNTDYGRDHHLRCFTAWLAGRGIKGGIEHGRTVDYSYNIVDADGQKTKPFQDDAIHINDLNAIILHLLGIDHRRLGFSYQGIDQRLTVFEERHT